MMSYLRRLTLLRSLWILLSASSEVQGFSIGPQQAARRHNSALSAHIDPSHIDAATIDHAIQAHDAIVTSAHQLLADATADVAEKSGRFSGLGSAWRSYLNIFKAALSGVHSTIEGPLRSVGIEQTWGPSIFLFTFMARSILVPLSIQQSKNSEYMKALKPYISEIKEKFKDNQDMQNRAIGKLYEDADQNPLAGCFTSLAQLPIFLGLYRGIRLLAMDGELEEPFLWIPNLEGPVGPPNYRGLDWLTKNWVDGHPQLGWDTTLSFLIMPVVLVVLQSLTMRVLQPPPDADASDEEREAMEKSQGILKFLPLMIGFFSLQVPAGLTIYWFTSNIFTLTQSLTVRAYFAANPPDIELPEYWNSALANKSFDEMTPEERREATKAGMSVGPSLTDLMDESKFHVVIPRGPIREDSEAWKRVKAQAEEEGKGIIVLPMEMEEWAEAAGTMVAAAAVASASIDANGATPVHSDSAEASTDATSAEPAEAATTA